MVWGFREVWGLVWDVEGVSVGFPSSSSSIMHASWVGPGRCGLRGLWQIVGFNVIVMH